MQTDCSSPQRVKRKCPLTKFSLALYALAGVSLLLYIAFRLSSSFADFFNRTVSRALRATLGWITSAVPFSLAEALLLCLPILLFWIVRAMAKTRSVRALLWKFCNIFAVFTLLFSIFVWNFQAGYFVSSIASEDKLDLDRQPLSAEDLYVTAVYLADKTNTAAQAVSFYEKDFSIMPYTREEMNDKLMAAYDTVCAEYDFIANFPSRVKPVALSEPMSYSHITGVYSYFTGEANINVNFPDYTLPFTAAHELAHQRGIAREDEANFIAYLVCISSDDPYLQYSGYFNMYEYVANALYSADPDSYYEVAGTLCSDVIYEMRAYSAFFDKYRENVVEQVSGAINDAYLKVQKTEGTRSYGLVVDLAAAYLKDEMPSLFQQQ